MCGIFIFEWVVYLFVCIPEAAPAVFFTFILTLGLWSYLRVALTDPGTTSSPEWKEWKEEKKAEIVATSSIDPCNDDATDIKFRVWQPGELTKCSHCAHIRPERSHHCRHCGVCVLRMDHHCPWVANCVGARNHK